MTDLVNVHDNVFTWSQAKHLYDFVNNSKFSINNWADREKQFEVPWIPCINSQWSLDDLKNSGAYSIVYGDKLRDFVRDRTPHQTVANLSHPGDTYFHHGHRRDGILIYCNVAWRREWAGETIFYDQTASDILRSVEPRPFRVVTFDRSIPHTVRPASYSAPVFRLTLTVLFEPNMDPDCP